MVLILIGIAVAGAVLTYETAVFIPAVVNAALSVWSNGVLANYGRHEARDAPDWAAAVSMVTTALGIAAIVYGLVT